MANTEILELKWRVTGPLSPLHTSSWDVGTQTAEAGVEKMGACVACSRGCQRGIRSVPAFNPVLSSLQTLPVRSVGSRQGNHQSSPGARGLVDSKLRPRSTPEPFLSAPGGSLGMGVTFTSPCFPALRALVPIGGGHQNLEDCPSARQPPPRRNMLVGRSSGLWSEGRWQSPCAGGGRGQNWSKVGVLG